MINTVARIWMVKKTIVRNLVYKRTEKNELVGTEIKNPFGPFGFQTTTPIFFIGPRGHGAGNLRC